MQRVLRELSKVIGLPDTIEIVKRWGGRELYVPRSVEQSDPLALTLGLVTARKLVEHWGGERLALPIERNALLDLRNESIVAASSAGKSNQEIALEYGLTRQSVAYILRLYKERQEIRKKFAVSKEPA